jgi:NADH:ubiquinone oxidoreductase subunit E
VCGFKDCRRVGGGKRLESLVSQVLRDEAASSSSGGGGTLVEVVDCLGECGYGPNLVVDGRLVNGVRGREAVLSALGVVPARDAASEGPSPPIPPEETGP